MPVSLVHIFAVKNKRFGYLTKWGYVVYKTSTKPNGSFVFRIKILRFSLLYYDYTNTHMYLCYNEGQGLLLNFV